MPVDPSNLDSIVAAAKKKMGGSFIHPGDSIPPVYRLPYDNLELNLATFGGGPMGRMIRFWGDYSSLKTVVAWGLAKQGQQHRSDLFPDGMVVCYHNIEGSYDPVFTSRLGVDIRKGRLIIAEGSLIEDVSRNLDALLRVAHIHIIDSVSAAQSVHAFTAPKEGRQPGFNSIAWQNALKSAEENMDKRENIIILIDQVRVDFRTQVEKEAGGKSIGHASSQTLHFRRSKKLYRSRPDAELSETRPQVGNDDFTGMHRVNGYRVQIEVNKSKVSRPFGRALLTWDADNSVFDKSAELVKAGIFLGVIKKSGSWYSIPSREKPIQGDSGLRDIVNNDPYLVHAIMEAADEYMKTRLYG